MVPATSPSPGTCTLARSTLAFRERRGTFGAEKAAYVLPFPLPPGSDRTSGGHGRGTSRIRRTVNRETVLPSKERIPAFRAAMDSWSCTV